jgi:hypothetical protein
MSASKLEAQGAEIVVGDLLDFRASGAFDVVQRAYFVYPIRPGIVQATAHFAEAAPLLSPHAIRWVHCRRPPHRQVTRGKRGDQEGDRDGCKGDRIQWRHAEQQRFHHAR